MPRAVKRANSGKAKGGGSGSAKAVRRLSEIEAALQTVILAVKAGTGGAVSKRVGPVRLVGPTCQIISGVVIGRPLEPAILLRALNQILSELQNAMRGLGPIQ